MQTIVVTRVLGKLMKNPIRESHFVSVREGLVVEALFCAWLDWLTGTPFYLTFPAIVATPLCLAGCLTARKKKPRADEKPSVENSADAVSQQTPSAAAPEIETAPGIN